MDCALDIFFLEAVLNGVLLAGLLALLALGLNLIFGVIDVVWICYAELVMVGMYGVFHGYQTLGLPLLLAMALGIVIVAVIGLVLHYLVIRPVLDTPPINQLLVTGGVLFFLQAVATMVFGIEFKNLGVHLGSVSFGDMFFPGTGSSRSAWRWPRWRCSGSFFAAPSSARRSARSARTARSCR
ncbi:MAG: hypothetical protein R3E87_01895 [Burkholderiaceae bacterium]